MQTVTWTILLSVVLHGISASPLAARYGASIAKAGKIPEKAPAGEPRIRLHDLAGRQRHEGQQQAHQRPSRHRCGDSRPCGISSRTSDIDSSAATSRW